MYNNIKNVVYQLDYIMGQFIMSRVYQVPPGVWHFILHTPEAAHLKWTWTEKVKIWCIKGDIYGTKDALNNAPFYLNSWKINKHFLVVENN